MKVYQLLERKSDEWVDSQNILIEAASGDGWDLMGKVQNPAEGPTELVLSIRGDHKHDITFVDAVQFSMVHSFLDSLVTEADIPKPYPVVRKIYYRVENQTQWIVVHGINSCYPAIWMDIPEFPFIAQYDPAEMEYGHFAVSALMQYDAQERIMEPLAESLANAKELLGTFNAKTSS